MTLLVLGRGILNNDIFMHKFYNIQCIQEIFYTKREGQGPL